MPYFTSCSCGGRAPEKLAVSASASLHGLATASAAATATVACAAAATATPACVHNGSAHLCSLFAGTCAGMFSRLTALVSGTSLPFDLGEEFPRGSGFGSWQHFRGTLRADSSAVSVFRLAAPGKGDARLDAGRHGVKRLRTLRHPNVLVFKDSLEVEERGEAVLYLITEPVTPLSEVLAGMRGADREQYLCMGLSELVSALSFLANDASLVHGAVSMGAVVVTQTLDWKLHGFDVLSEHQFASQYDLPLTAAEWLVSAQYKPGEVAKRDWQVGAWPAHLAGAKLGLT